MTGTHPHSILRIWYVAAFLALCLIAKEMVRLFDAPDSLDFISFWAAAKLTIAGDAALAFDPAAHQAVQAAIVPPDGLMSFAYPPPSLLLLWPFGLMDYSTALILWVIMGLLAYAWCAERALPGLLPMALAFPPMIVSGILGQNGWLTAGLFMGGLALLRPHPFTAGLLFGCLAMKPQLAVLVPLALLAGREWRALLGSITGFTGLCLISLIVFGLEPWRNFFAILPLYGSAAAEGSAGWHKIASLYAALRMVGVPAMAAATIHAALAACAVVGLWRVWRDPSLERARGAMLAAATLLISPYLYLYDHALLIVAVAWMVSIRVPQAAIGALFALSFLGMAQMLVPGWPVNVMPLVPMLVFALLVWRLHLWRAASGTPAWSRA